MCSFRMSDNKNSNSTKFLDPVERKEEIIDGPENTAGTESGSSINEEEKESTGKFLEGTGNVAADKSGNIIINTAGDDDGDEGFRTPISSEHRIPAITECPPAPRKPRPSRLKRRRSPEEAPARRCLEFDSLEEVESVFRPAVPDIENEPAIKKARRDNDDDDDDDEKRK